MAKEKCKECGMVRSVKDLVLLENGERMCFECWNKINPKEKK